MMEKLKHLDWKKIGVAVSSLLYMLAVAPYTLGEVADFIPPKFKSKVFAVCLIIGFLLRLWNSRKQPIPTVTMPTPSAQLPK